MTLTELMLGSVQSKNSASVMQLGAQSTAKSPEKDKTASFAGILDGKLSSTSGSGHTTSANRSSYSTRDRSSDTTVKNNDQQKYQTFREASAAKNVKAAGDSSVKRETKVSDNSEERTEKVQDDAKDGNTQNSNPNNLLQAFAQVLGINVGELQKLIKKAGITPESFNNMQKLNDNVAKLSQLLGLNSEQEETLTKLIELTEEAMGSVKAETAQNGSNELTAQDQKAETGEIAKAATATTANVVTAKAVTVKSAGTEPAQAAGTQPATEQIDDSNALADKLNAEIKLKLDVFGKKLSTEPDKVVDDLKQLFQPKGMTVQVEVQASDNGKKNEDAGKTDKTDAKAEANTDDPKTAVAANAAETSSGKSDDTGKEANPGTGKEITIQQPVTEVKETQAQPAFAAIQSDQANTNTAQAIDRAVPKTPVSAREILNQVIEKAKVVLTPDKSEMVLDLKPDSLGKISLKVTTENGMVMAKFVADSQQVRQVLETNMQLLKDSLERQGMNVQGFSVSVRQDSDRPNQNWTQQRNGKSFGTGGTAYRTSGVEGSLTGKIEAAMQNSSYNWGGSTINLTA